MWIPYASMFMYPQEHLKCLDSISLYRYTRVYLTSPLLFGNIYCSQIFTSLNIASLLDILLFSDFLASSSTLRSWPLWTDQLVSSHVFWFWPWQETGSPCKSVSSYLCLLPKGHDFLQVAWVIECFHLNNIPLFLSLQTLQLLAHDSCIISCNSFTLVNKSSLNHPNLSYVICFLLDPDLYMPVYIFETKPLHLPIIISTELIHRWWFDAKVHTLLRLFII